MPGTPMTGAPMPGMPLPGDPMQGFQTPGIPSANKAGGMAIASLILSVSGLLCGVTAIVGIVLGVIELGRIKKGESSEKGRGLAKAGVIIGSIAIGLSVLITIISIATGGFSFEVTT